MNPVAIRAAGAAPVLSEKRMAWCVLLAGYAAMVLPTYWNAAHSLWQNEEQAHGPLVLSVVVWHFWRQRHALARAPLSASPHWAWPLFGVGLASYVVGRLVGISVLEFGAQPLVLASGLLLFRGVPSLRAVWFAVFYTVFLVPLPAVLVDAMTGPLKQWISALVEGTLFAAGYPIARTGGMISVGQYQLLVADACSGLNSMISLSALGTLFMYIMARTSRLYTAIMLASILPIAFGANMVRVIVLVLVTYHMGDEAGQGFLHDAAGIVLMLAALLGFFALDAVLARAVPGGPHRPRSRSTLA